MRIFNKILYFFLVVILLSSMGIWVPLAIDFFPKMEISSKTLEVMPGNILTYYLSILLIGLIDRIIYIIRNREYIHKITEVLILGIVIIGLGIITYFAFLHIASRNFSAATLFSVLGAIFSYVIWWLANYRDRRVDPINALGGEINE